MTDPRRHIPSLEQILESTEFTDMLDQHPRTLVLNQLRTEVERVREEITAGGSTEDTRDPRRYAKAVLERLRVVTTPSLRPVINGTGVILHTNLGRAAQAPAALEAMTRVARGYSNLEYELSEGRRGSRYDHCTRLLCELTGAESALVLNNGAAALVLALRTMAFGREVLVSRGELVEIGGGFRIPEILGSSGAVLVEVGSTNRTRLQDYQAEMAGEKPAMILKVHRSNFRITGFTEEATLEDLVGLGRDHGVPVVHDLGSGLMVDAASIGLPEEPRPVDSLAAGVDIVAFSGDKLLGGPQAGILLGKREWIESMRRDPLCRALRVDKTTLAGLEATLRLYQDPAVAIREIPVLAMLSADIETLRHRAGLMVEHATAGGVSAEVADVTSVVGGGTFPGVEIASCGIRVRPGDGGADGLAADLRGASTPLVGRVEDGSFWVDLRTVLPTEDDEVVELLSRHAR